jgi:hypothetical protein
MTELEETWKHKCLTLPCATEGESGIGEHSAALSAPHPRTRIRSQYARHTYRSARFIMPEVGAPCKNLGIVEYRSYEYQADDVCVGS